MRIQVDTEWFHTADPERKKKAVKKFHSLPNKAKAHHVYKTEDGVPVKSVTQVLGVRAKPAVINWAWELGLAGFNHEEAKNEAGSIGTVAHALIAGDESVKSEYVDTVISSALFSLGSYMDWEKRYSPKIIERELSLVSNNFRFGGTLDLYCEINGQKTLVDFKTGKGLYPEHKLQLAAYDILLRENGYDLERHMVVRIGNATKPGLQVKEYDINEDHYNCFLALLDHVILWDKCID